MSSRQTHVITVAFLALLGAGAFWKSSSGSFRLPSRAPQDTPGGAPEDVIYAALDAQRLGDSAKYLENYSGQLRDALLRAGQEMGSEATQRSLREKGASIKGIAVTQPETIDNGQVKAVVEYIYADRNEKQTYYLNQSGQTWKIVRIDGVESAKPIVPYATPVK